MKVVRKSRSRQILEATRRQMHRAISKGVETGEETMKRLVPVDEGDLASTCRGRDDGQGHGQLMAGGFSEISDKFVDYELHVEFGTHEMSAQPYFRPAVSTAKNVVRKNMRMVKR